MKKTYLFLLIFIWSVGAYANRPRIGLVLGGGGAKGAAEIGVLKVIDKARKAGLHIDYIAGTSMGAVVGGLYAAGISPNDIERLFLTEKWLTIFSGDAVGYISKAGWRAPTGLIRSDVIQAKLDSVFSTVNRRFFSNTLIPFNCVAVDLEKFKEERLCEGVLARAILASMSYPGFLPVQQDGKKLIDGGVLNNLPVDIVRMMGADIVIVIDLEQKTPSPRSFSLKGSLGIGGIANWLISRPDITKRDENIKSLMKTDIYIKPNLRDYSIKDFDGTKLKEMILIGEKEGNRIWNELMKLK